MATSKKSSSRRRARTTRVTATTVMVPPPEITRVAKASAFNFREMIRDQVREVVAELTPRIPSVAIGQSPSANVSVEVTGDLGHVAERLEAVRLALIERCGSLSVAIERITGRTIIPNAPPKPGLNSSALTSKLGRLHESIDEINTYLAMLEEISIVVGQL